MPRKADPLDAAKISSRGQPVEMGEVVELPKRGRKPKAQAVVPEPNIAPEPVQAAAPVPQVIKNEEPPPPPRKLDSYVVVKESKAWLRGSLITFTAGKVIGDHTHGVGTISKLLAQGVELQKVED